MIFSKIPEKVLICVKIITVSINCYFIFGNTVTYAKLVIRAEITDEKELRKNYRGEKRFATGSS